MQRTPRGVALSALALTTLVLSAAVSPFASAGTISDDLLEARDDDGGGPEDCPPTPLDRLVVCLVHDAVFNNSYVRVVLEHVGHHYQNASQYRNATVQNVNDAYAATLEFEWRVEWATYVYVFETYGNVDLLGDDLVAVSDDARAYAGYVAYNECVWTLGRDCPMRPRSEDGSPETDGGSLLNPSTGTGPCDGLVHFIRCHYTTTSHQTVNATGNASRDTQDAVGSFKARQEYDTGVYLIAVNGALREYVRDLGDEAVDQYGDTLVFVSNECALLYSGCPMGFPSLEDWYDWTTVDLLA